MWCDFLYVELVVPVDHVLANIVPLLVVTSHALIPIRLDIVMVARVIRADHLLKTVPLLESHMIEVHNLLQDAVTAIILGNELNQLIDDPLEVSVSLVAQLAVAVEVHEELHTFALSIACLTDESKEKKCARQYFQLLIVNVDVESMLAGSVRQWQVV